MGAGGGTAHAGLTMLVNLFSTAFGYLQLGYAAAMSVVLFLIMVTFSLAFYRLQRVNPAD